MKLPLGKGTRSLKLNDIAPDCEITVRKERIYDLEDLSRNAAVLDIGCGYGRNRKLVESVEGIWVGLELFPGGEETLLADAQMLPFPDSTFEVVIADAVLEHIPDPALAFSEISRVLKPGGVFVGYVAFMECFHEISYCHLSFKALEHFSTINNMKLEKVAGGRNFGIDYHFGVLLNPLPGRRLLRGLLAFIIRTFMRLKSSLAYIVLRAKRKLSHADAKNMSDLFFKIECLRQSTGFSFLIRKKECS